MISIIVGTNRRDSEALTFARIYQDEIERQSGEKPGLVTLEHIPGNLWHPDMYDSDKQAPEVKQIQDELMIPADKMVFVVPEYNGGFPGALKLFLDAISVREYKKTFKGKKALLVGVATGRAGNLRGLEHLTGILNHVGTIVHPNRLPISAIEKLLNERGQLEHENTKKVISKQVEEFLAF
jgi:NAD(P)H-dependent FMN reductase